MGELKQVTNIREDNKFRAIQSHAGFVSCIVGTVKKIGIETVLQQYKSLHETTEYFWLKKAYERVLDFAEQVQLKEITQKIGGDPDRPIEIEVNIKTTTEDNFEIKNRLRTPPFTITSLQ